MSDYLDSLYNSLDDESRAIIAAGIGFNDGANKGFWRYQPRDFKGRWAEMGAEIRAAFKKLRKVMSRKGYVVGSGGTPDTVRVYHPADEALGLPEEIAIYPSDAVELIGATLTPEYLRSVGVDPDKDVNGNAVSYKSIEDNPNIPDYETLPREAATEDDRRLAKEGAASPEGAEMSKFKDSPEGQEVAKLPSAAASKVSKGKEDVAKLIENAGAPESSLAEANLARVPEEEQELDVPGYTEYKGIGDGDNGFIGLENLGGGNWEFTNYNTGEIFPIKADNLADAERQIADFRLERGEFDPAVLGARADAETAGKRGFTETMRSSLTGMKGRSKNGGFAKAYPNGRTATVVQDEDGSWHLEKHDEFNGGIQETKRFEDNYFQSGLDQALEEGDAYLNDNIAKKMTREEFGNYVENRYSDAERTKPTFLDEAAIDEAYSAYSSYYDESKSDNGWVTKDMDADARSEAFSEMDDMAVAEERDPLGLGDTEDLKMSSDLLDDEGDSGDGSDEEEEDFIPEEEIDDFEPSMGDSDPELLRDIISKERAEAGDVGPGDVIMGPGNMPVRIKRMDWDESDYDEEPAGMNIVATDANGEEVEFYKGRYDTVMLPEFADENAAPAAKPEVVTPKKATKKTPEPTPEVAPEPATPTRIAPDTAFEADASRVDVGDKLYNADGTEFLGEVTQVRRKRDGSTEARLNLDGKDEGFRKLDPTHMVDRNYDVVRQRQAEKDAKKAEAAKAKEQKRIDAEREAADKAARENDPRTDEGIDNLRSILEAANNPGRLQPAIDVLNDPSLSNEEKAGKLLEVLNRGLGLLNGTDEQRMAARQAENKAMKVLEKAGIPGASLEERRAANDKRRSRSAIEGNTFKYPASLTLASEVDAMKKRLEAGEDVPLEETEALGQKIRDYQDRFWMKGGGGGNDDTPMPGEKERVEEEIRKAQREGTAPIPFVRQDGTEIRPDDNVTTPAAPGTPPVQQFVPATPSTTPGAPGTPNPTPNAPKPRKPIKKQPKPKPLGTPDDDGKPINADIKSPADIEAMRGRMLQKAFDDAGNPVYATDIYGNPILDKKGRPVQLMDTDAILAAVRADYPDAKLTPEGDIVVHRENYTGADGKKKQFELLVHRNDGGKIGLSLQFTDLETGAVERLVHHDERDSYAALHNKNNGINGLIDIVQGKKPGTDRKTATRGYDTTGRTDYRERAEYFVRQGRLMTVEQTWRKYLDGQAEEINLSKGGGGAAWLTKRKSEIPSAAEALRSGDMAAFYMRVRAAIGHTPNTVGQRVEMRKAIRDYLTDEFPQMSNRDKQKIAWYVDRSMRGMVLDPTGRDNPFSSREVKLLKPGMWVDYINNMGEKSRGRVVEMMEPQLNESGTEYNDNVVVEFADGTRVPMLTSQNMIPVPAQEQAKATATPYIPNVKGAEMRRRRIEQLNATFARQTGIARFLEDVRAERAELEESGNKSGAKVEDLNAGDTFFGKDGAPLGVVIETIPIVSKNGTPGIAVIFENADGEESQVRLPLGEFRGPKA